MFRLFRSMDRSLSDGEALPPVFDAFTTHGVQLFRSDLAMFAGPPGAGKSALALNYALRACVPTLYISCDMPPSVVATRVAGILSRKAVNQVREEMRTEEGRAEHRTRLASVEHLYMAYPSRPDAKGLALAVAAFTEVWGCAPSLMVIDNMMNLFSGGDNEWAGLREVSHLLHFFATDMGTSVLALHHINLGGIDLTVPAPLNAIKGQVSELPAVILTFTKVGSRMILAPVKNRHGSSDPTGKTAFELSLDEESQYVGDAPPPPSYWEDTSQRVVPDWFSRAVKDG